MECRQCEHFLQIEDGFASGLCKANWGKNKREFTRTYYPSCENFKNQAMKIIKGLWYLCTKSHSYFLKDHWHYSPMDGYLNGSDNLPHRVYGFHRKYFTGGEEFRFIIYQNK